MIKRNNSARIFTYLFLGIITFVSIYPLYFAFISSFKNLAEYTQSNTAFPASMNLENYAYVFRNMEFSRFILNSIITVTTGMVLYIIICNAAGFALGLLRFRFKLSIFSFILFFQIFPQMVIAAQVFRICSKIGLMNSYIGLVLVWTAYFAPFGTYIMSTYYATIPRSMIESARIDGAGVFRQLFSIMMPMATPMIGTIGIVGSLAMWTELPFSLLLISEPAKRPLSLGIAIMKGEHGIPVPVLSAAILVSAAIPLILYFIFQKTIHMGSTAGAVKG
ncbi:carbohydrate ABC transporter permease [Oceanispirochaeta sp.]|jgi:raffinose/stachyose/melibiose transport system permease protein|uniref:carbohydrate ABC transporter permease n=1 Tax=Oceanispirochaeta sp. TaxID=2035350 RepID=UPI00260438E5|nr:carbohydrate ABC transporter permease [Oceanispirochaeta sp.]MDA3955653.1 carbohydrate ABC transporter permease [Oceanispirochaeta sp.]